MRDGEVKTEFFSFSLALPTLLLLHPRNVLGFDVALSSAAIFRCLGNRERTGGTPANLQYSDPLPHRTAVMRISGER